MQTLTIAKVDVQLLRYRLPKPVGGSGVAIVDVIVTELTLSNQTSGLGLTFVPTGGADVALRAARHLAERTLLGQPLHHPEATWMRMSSALNRTRRGPNYLGMSSLDVAIWDAYARHLDVPLGIAMGGAPRSVKVYGSGGFTAAQSPDEVAAIAREHVARGLGGVKPRVNGRRSDELVMRAVAEALPAQVEFMVDANEKCSATMAHRLLATAREHRALFVEEPLVADDIAGHRELGHAFPGLVATGEHLQGVGEILPFLAEKMIGLAQPDLAMMGGLTEVLRVARLAQTFGIEASPHFLPGLFVHVAAAATSITWLEEFPLAEPLFAGWPALAADGTLSMRDVAGHGLALADGARDAFQLRID